MSIYSPQRKAIFLSPNRLDLLHRRRGLSDDQNGCMVCAVQSGKVSWQEFADWLSARGFRIEKARPLYVTLAAPGIPYTRFGWLHSCAELDRFYERNLELVLKVLRLATSDITQHRVATE